MYCAVKAAAATAVESKRIHRHQPSPSAFGAEEPSSMESRACVAKTQEIEDGSNLSTLAIVIKQRS